MKGYSDGYLLTLRRLVVRARAGDQCEICGSTSPRGLQDHHIIKRRVRITRYDPDNGIYLCAICHGFAHTKRGEEKVRDIIGEKRWSYLASVEMVTLKQELVRAGQTKKEWETMWGKALKLSLDSFRY